MTAKERVEMLVNEIALRRKEGKSYVAVAHELNVYVDMWIDEVEVKL